ncbi:ribosome small subunit-dependent GTPase A [Metabacillus sp. RGM 3146]|uniref:ribosome small subunit-dependent GTPase A n=1 Tax=Metabacillus sp. RGM 3146 TaxID=3401092 RepID=UPI003B9C9D5E
MNLVNLGWNEDFEKETELYQESGYSFGRVSLEHKRIYRVILENGEILAEISGKMRFVAESREDYPAVGDWVAVTPRFEEQKGTIHGILPRKSKFSRKAAGDTTEEQIVAANIDTLFIVAALNNDFNIRRIERYLIMAWESGANPVIVLNKADLCSDKEEKRKEIESAALGVPVYFISALHGSDDLEEIKKYAENGQTIALIGSSGVGKSTLTNRLLGKERQATQEVRVGDDRGKHTTTYRELLPLPEGGCLIDTPGMRELQLWSADVGFQGTFEDIEELGLQCQFADCRHKSEPNCAILQAIEEGELDADRFESYKKLQRELAYLSRKEDKKAQADEKAKWKSISKTMRHQKKKL